jgi:ABC-2 type transport system permease protein
MGAMTAEPAADRPRPRAGLRFRAVAKGVYAIWYRETRRFVRDRSRWLGLVTQPLLYLMLVGYGISSSMTFRRLPADSSINYVTFMYPGIVGMSVLFTSIFSAVSIIWDREFGFLKEVLVAPLPRWAAAAGKALGIMTIVALQTAVLLAMSPLAHVPLGLWMALKTLGVASLVGFVLGAFGIAVASRMTSFESFQLIMNLVTMPMFFLSGALYPLRGLPPWLNFLAHVDPLTYGVDALRNAIYADNEAARLLVQYPLVFDIGVLAAIAAVFAALAGWLFETQE